MAAVPMHASDFLVKNLVILQNANIFTHRMLKIILHILRIQIITSTQHNIIHSIAHTLFRSYKYIF